MQIGQKVDIGRKVDEVANICAGKSRSLVFIFTICNTSLFLFKTNILFFVSSKPVKNYSRIIKYSVKLSNVPLQNELKRDYYRGTWG